MRSLSLLVLAAWLCLAASAYADDSSTAQSPPADQPPAASPPPSGPALQPSDNAPTPCDPTSPRAHFVEVRGTGFNAWAAQHLVGNVVDARGVAQIQWSSVWVSPQGQLTVEVNLCADQFRNRPALPAGNYTVTIGAASGAPIAATSIAVAPPPAPAAEADTTTPATDTATPATDTATPATDTAAPATDTAAPATDTAPPTTVTAPPATDTAATPPAPTPLPTLALPASLLPTPTPGPRTGPGSPSQPFPLGAPGNLVDGWQLVVSGVTPDAWSGIHAAVPSSVAPAPDQRDYMVRIQATFLGQGTGVFSAMRLALQTGSQTMYDQLHNGCGIVPDMVPPNVVTSGTVVRGNVCFAVRASDLDSLVLLDNQSAESDRLYFALK